MPQDGQKAKLFSFLNPQDGQKAKTEGGASSEGSFSTVAGCCLARSSWINLLKYSLLINISLSFLFDIFSADLFVISILYAKRKKGVDGLDRSLIYFTSDIFGSALFGQPTEVKKVTATTTEEYTAHSGLGAKCKVEAISRTDLLRARGFKVDDFDIPLNPTE